MSRKPKSPLSEPDLAEFTRMNNELVNAQRTLAKSNQELARHRARFWGLLQDVCVAIAVVDVSGQTRFINPSCARLFGLGEAEMVGHPFPLDLGIVDPDCASPLTEYTISRLDGSQLTVETSYLRSTWESDPVFVVTMQDVSARVLAEAVRANVESIIKHDLRTPACGAISIAQMLSEDTSLTEEQRFLLGLFKDSASNMLDTLDSFTDLYKIEMGRYHPKLQKSDCLVVLKKLIDILTKNPRFANINIDLLVSPQPLRAGYSSCFCLCDPKLLRTALWNLLVNALEASTPGEAVVVTLSWWDKDCLIEITNKGLVPLEIRDRFFEKYVTSGKHNGTGLGTYSAMKMIEAQGGKISMRTSDEDNKTVLTVRMPC
jgi:signal transduction histidine kinase